MNKKTVIIIGTILIIVLTLVVLFIKQSAGSDQTNTDGVVRSYQDDSEDLEKIFSEYNYNSISEYDINTSDLLEENAFRRDRYSNSEIEIVGLAKDEESSKMLAGNCLVTKLNYFIIKGDRAVEIDDNILLSIAKLNDKQDYLNFLRVYKSFKVQFCKTSIFYANNDYIYEPSNPECKTDKEININTELVQDDESTEFYYYIENNDRRLELNKAGIKFTEDGMELLDVENVYSCNN